MAQHDYVIANQSGAAFRADLNNALAAVVSQNSGAAEPSTTYAYMPWADTTAGVMKLRNGANNAWITLYQLDGEWTNIALENGTAVTPSLYFKGSGTDTGIYSSGADALDFATAGVRRVGISSAGDLVVFGGAIEALSQGPFRFYDSDSSNYVGLRAPSTVGANVIFALPGVDGLAGHGLCTDGAGNLSFTAGTVPTGTVIWQPASVAPTGYIKANGAALSRTTYAGLWTYAQASGNLAASEGAKQAGQFGPGNGSTTFTIPDLRGEFVRGWDDSRGVDSGRGIGTAQAQDYQSHGHGVTDPGHIHSLSPYSAVAATASLVGNQGPTPVFGSGLVTTGTTANATGISIQNNGGTETRPRNVALLACIKF